MLHLAHVGSLLALLIEEVVASCNEPLPHHVAIFLGNGTYGLPFLLECNKLIGSLFPVGRIFESFSLLA